MRKNQARISKIDSKQRFKGLSGILIALIALTANGVQGGKIQGFLDFMSE
jgi:hypothetical protein